MSHADTLTGRVELFVKSVMFDRVPRLHYRLRSTSHPLNPFQQILRVQSFEATVEAVSQRKLSVVRFGDGEMELMNGHDIGFQAYNTGLAERLRSIAASNSSKIALCIPDVFRSLELFTPETERWYLHYLRHERARWYAVFDPNRTYYNAFITRPYMDWRDKSDALSRFTQVKSIWSGRDVLVIEGELTRLGVGNDLLDNAASIRRILCPAENAYDFYDRILAEAAGNRPADLVLVSLGPTAKPLVFDLSHRGFQAIDVGHLDVEYEWCLRGAEQKTQLPGKYVNEVDGGKGVTDCDDPIYQDQTVCRIR